MAAASEPGSPLTCTDDSPVTAPASMLLIEPVGVSARALPFTLDTAPVTVTFFCTP